MGFCIACAELTRVAPLCESCGRRMRRGSTHRVGDGFTVAAAFRHSGPARRLVHRLKYEGVRAAADLLAATMAGRLPPGATGLVPLPRASARRARYGVDPARELAAALSRITGLSVIRALRPAIWWPRHAIRPTGNRRPPRFTARRPVPAGAVLVDDVTTSGSTMLAALSAIGGDIRHGLVATCPGTMQLPAQ